MTTNLFNRGNTNAKKTLIDKYLPQYTFGEHHETVVNCPIQNVYDVARDFDLSKSKLIKFLFRLRGVPTKRLSLLDFIVDMGFTYLEENPPYDNLTGFWMRPRIERIPSKNASQIRIVERFRKNKKDWLGEMVYGSDRKL